MSEQINKVLASTAQAFSTAEQKQARDNIDAQQSITYSYSGNTITAIDGSAVGSPGAITNIVHDSNLSGSGTSGSPLGLASVITLSANDLPGTSEITPYSFQICQTGSATARLRDNRLSFYESSKPSAYYDRTGLQFGATADVRTTLAKNLKFEYDAGGNLESITYGLNGFAATTYTPTGTNQDTGVVSIYGISGVNGFGDSKIWDNWRSSKRAQMSSDGVTEKSVIDMYIGYNNGEQELYPAYIGFYNPYDGSAFIYQSSIVAWNNNLSAEKPVTVGYGLEGSGTSGSPLSATGFKCEYLSPYASSCMSSDRTSIDIFTDTYSGRIHEAGIWFKYGGNVFHSASTEWRTNDFTMRDYTDDNSVYLEASSIKMYYHLNDSTASASAEINANVLSSLFAWAMSNGWTP